MATYGKCISIECSSSSASRDITSKSPVARSSSFIARSMFKSYRGVRYYQCNGNGLIYRKTHLLTIIIILSYDEKHILPLHNLTLRSHLTGHDERVPKWTLFLYLMDQFWRMHDLRMLHSIYNQHEDRWWPGQLDCRLQSDIKYNLKHIFNKAFYNLKKI